MVLQDPLSNRCVYYQDKGKRYRFVTDATEGMPLLCDLVTTNRDLLARNEAIMGVDAAVRDCPRPQTLPLINRPKQANPQPLSSQLSLVVKLSVARLTQ